MVGDRGYHWFTSHNRDGIPSLPSSWNASVGPLNITSQPWCWNTPAAIPGMMKLLYRHQCRRGRFGVFPTIRAHTSHPLYLPPPLPSVRPMRPPPHWIWWGTEGTTDSPPIIPGMMPWNSLDIYVYFLSLYGCTCSVSLHCLIIRQKTLHNDRIQNILNKNLFWMTRQDWVEE